MDCRKRFSIGPAAIAVVLISGFTLAGGTAFLGAHPWWAYKVSYIGATIGAFIWFALAVIGPGHRSVLLTSSGALGVSAITVWFGKTRFVASYADDAFAGRLWYFGWIAAMAAAFLVIAGLSFALLGRRWQ